MSVLLIVRRNVRWPRRMLPLLSHVEYALLRLEKDGTDRRADARPSLRLSLNAVG